MTMTLERPAEVTNEHNHSCTSQCPPGCPAARTEVDVTLAPGLTTEG